VRWMADGSEVSDLAQGCAVWRAWTLRRGTAGIAYGCLLLEPEPAESMKSLEMFAIRVWFDQAHSGGIKGCVLATRYRPALGRLHMVSLR
jgi:hypothetical protein